MGTGSTSQSTVDDTSKLNVGLHDPTAATNVQVGVLHVEFTNAGDYYVIGADYVTMYIIIHVLQQEVRYKFKDKIGVYSKSSLFQLPSYNNKNALYRSGPSL